MGKIHILDETVSNIIAAGEVVENPSNMIKELLENALDAESKNITIMVAQGGRNVTIRDDGVGMAKEDLYLATERHATSKISTKEDLYALSTYGFRGEALSSIAGISKMSISSRTRDSEIGNRITLLGGKITSISEVPMSVGTTLEIKDLFYNTPARLKFLRKNTTEYTNMKDVVIREALANPDISITLVIDGVTAIKTSGNGIENTIIELFSANVLQNMEKCQYGYLGNANIFRKNRNSMFVFVNNRPVKSKVIEDAVIDGYYTKLMKGVYPFCILFVDVDPKSIDVNVHPTKKIVKFANNGEIYNQIYECVKETISGKEDFTSPTLAYSKESDSCDVNRPEPSYIVTNTQKQLEICEPGPSVSTTTAKEAFFYYSVMSDVMVTPDDNDKKLNIVHNFHIFGQIYDTFILVFRNGVFEIYDQHIVHERTLYEELKRSYENRKIGKQMLLMPIEVHVDPRDMSKIIPNKDILSEFGFDIKTQGDTAVYLYSVPAFDFRDSMENIFADIVENIDKENYSVFENIIVSMSCKGAIKANARLTLDEMRELIDRFLNLGEYTCPHGRPIMIRVTQDDLEKLFKRIV